MKTKFLYTLLVLFLGISVASFANPAEKKMKNGKLITVSTVSEGTVNLYSIEVETLKPTIPEDPMESYTETHTRYFVGNPNEEIIEEITIANYKKVLLNHLEDNDEIATKIGSKGYKFINVEGIFIAYNAE
jgi:hypothetical protein